MTIKKKVLSVLVYSKRLKIYYLYHLNRAVKVMIYRYSFYYTFILVSNELLYAVDDFYTSCFITL